MTCCKLWSAQQVPVGGRAPGLPLCPWRAYLQAPGPGAWKPCRGSPGRLAGGHSAGRTGLGWHCAPKSPLWGRKVRFRHGQGMNGEAQHYQSHTALKLHALCFLHIPYIHVHRPHEFWKLLCKAGEQECMLQATAQRLQLHLDFSLFSVKNWFWGWNRSGMCSDLLWSQGHTCRLAPFLEVGK